MQTSLQMRPQQPPSQRAAGRSWPHTAAEMQALGGHHQGCRAAVNTPVVPCHTGPGWLSPEWRSSCEHSSHPHHVDTTVHLTPPGPFSETESHCGAQAELALSKVLPPQSPMCPGCPHTPHQSPHYVITRWVLLREQVTREEETSLRFTACGWKELMENIYHPQNWRW